MTLALFGARTWRLLVVAAGAVAIARFAATGCSPFGASEDDGPSGDAGLVDGQGVSSSEAGPGDASAQPCDAALCTDFDPPSDTVPFGWDRVGTAANAGARLVLLRGDGRSAPNALRLAADVTGGFEGSLYLEKKLGGANELSLSFALRVEALAASGARAGRVVEVVCGNKTLTRVKVNTAGKLYLDAEEEALVVSQNVLAPNAWHPIRLHMTGIGDPDGGLATASLVETNEANEPGVLASCDADVHLRVGVIVDTDGTGTYVFSLDDIVADWR